MSMIEEDNGFSFQDVILRNKKYNKKLPRLGIRTAVARFNYAQSIGGKFGFSTGDRILLYDNVDELYWEGRNVRTGLEGRFEHLYVQLVDVPSEEEDENLGPETLSSINEREVMRIKKAYGQKFGTGLEPLAIFRVMQTMHYSFKTKPYDDMFASFSMAYPNSTQWLSLLNFEMKAFRNFYNGYRYSSYEGTSKYEFEEWPKGYDEILSFGPAHYAWSPSLQRCRISVPNVETIWHALKNELLQIEDLGDWFDLGSVIKRVETVLGRFRSSLNAMNRADEEWKRQREQANEKEVEEPRSSLQYQDFDLEAGKLAPTVIKRHRIRDFRRSLPSMRDIWSTTLASLGAPYGVIYTVVSFATFGGVTTALAAWKCNPPELRPTVDSNFWSTLASSSIGIAGLFCTIIPMLRNQSIKVGNERLFRQLLWASLVLAVASSVVYLWQTRASLVLLYLSSATQLATTLQIIYGAVERIEENMMRIDYLEDVVANGRPVA